MNKLITLSAITAIGLSMSACKSDRTNLAPGEYEHTTTNVDSSGTKTVKSTHTDVTVDEYGNKTAVIETETTKDPRGLFNKETTSSKEVIREGQ